MESNTSLESEKKASEELIEQLIDKYSILEFTYEGTCYYHLFRESNEENFVIILGPYTKNFQEVINDLEKCIIEEFSTNILPFSYGLLEKNSLEPIGYQESEKFKIYRNKSEAINNLKKRLFRIKEKKSTEDH